jgi:hypothetical protein
VSDDEVIEEKTYEADGMRVDTSEPSIVIWGLRDIEGTFEGTLNDAVVLNDFVNRKPGPMEVYLYGPVRDLPWYAHWFYRIRQRVRGTPYPSEVYAYGPATFNVEAETEDDSSVNISGRFTKAGVWTINE